MSSFRGTWQVCARVRQVCERLAGPLVRMRCGMRRGRPAPEQKSRQRIGFSSVGRIDRATDSGKPQVRAPPPCRLPRPHPKIRSFGGIFAWHRAPTPPNGFFGPRRRFSRPGGGRGASRLPAGAPEGGPACRGTKYKTTHVALENVTAGRLGFAPHCTVACRKCSRIYRWCSLAHLKVGHRFVDFYAS